MKFFKITLFPESGLSNYGHIFLKCVSLNCLVAYFKVLLDLLFHTTTYYLIATKRMAVLIITILKKQMDLKVISVKNIFKEFWNTFDLMQRHVKVSLNLSNFF